VVTINKTCTLTGFPSGLGAFAAAALHQGYCKRMTGQVLPSLKLLELDLLDQILCLISHVCSGKQKYDRRLPMSDSG
jgi:hypothetical protein